MKDIKITVLETVFLEELAQEYAQPTLGPCTRHPKGSEYISPGGRMPEGFCEEAWAAIGRYAFALAHGAPGFWPNWMKLPGMTINTCNDGVRPVVFKLEIVP
ncbi:MAG: TIGR04076 family protein [Symbiobacteriaceae bacterium]|nr:TIGR04076 family protein [Symbiobacteriaceae bacterium]